MHILMALLLALPLQVDGDSELNDEALVKRIRETLARIDDALLETSEATDARASLAAVRERHLQVIRDLERLIDNQKYRPSGQGGGGGGESSDSPSGQSSGDSSARPNDGSGAPNPGEEQASPPDTGEGEGERDAGAEEQQQGRPQGGTPEGGLGDEDPGRNEQADGPPPPDTIEPVTREDVDERWGLLPPKLQERLMNLHVDDVPARYRGWMEAYVRSMHALENRASGQGSGSGSR